MTPSNLPLSTAQSKTHRTSYKFTSTGPPSTFIYWLRSLSPVPISVFKPILVTHLSLTTALSLTSLGSLGCVISSSGPGLGLFRFINRSTNHLSNSCPNSLSVLFLDLPHRRIFGSPQTLDIQVGVVIYGVGRRPENMKIELYIIQLKYIKDSPKGYRHSRHFRPYFSQSRNTYPVFTVYPK